ncbi:MULTISPECIES: SHOCT domain-containing protein [unclassified Isoptericola]|uniref:SHOCT domain-containing protein n=1 Tax=unclassified Isoptericola TaxID=2623355 RepID=UPI0036496C18
MIPDNRPAPSDPAASTGDARTGPALEDDLYGPRRAPSPDAVRSLVALAVAAVAVAVLRWGAREWQLVTWDCGGGSCASDDVASLAPVLGIGLLVLAAALAWRATRAASVGLAAVTGAAGFLWGWHDAVAQHLAGTEDVRVGSAVAWTVLALGAVAAVVVPAAATRRGPAPPAVPVRSTPPARPGPATTLAGERGGGDGDDIVGRLERLRALHRSGALTDEEYAAAKRRLLG